MKVQPGQPASPGDKRGPSKKIANSLVAASSAAILAVYTAGYLRTKPIADRFAVEEAERRPAPAAAGEAAASAATWQPAEGSSLTAVETPLSGVPSAEPGARAPVTTPDSPTDARPQLRATDSPVESSGLDAGSATPPSLSPQPAPAEAPASAPSTASAEVTGTEPLLAAPEPPAVTEPPTAAAAPLAQYRDGTYLGWGYSRHGNIQASVVVEGGRIVSAEIAQCRTRYSCSWVEHLPRQILERQQAAVDFVSGATQSSYAFEDAVAEALAKAK